MNERMERRRSHALRARAVADDEVQALHQASLETTVGEPEVIRHALAFAHYCAHRRIIIFDDDLIVGAPAHIRHDDGEVATSVFPRQPFVSPWPVSEHLQLRFQEGMFSGAGNHTTMDYETILAIGFDGLIEQIDARMARLSSEEADYQGKQDFLRALRIVAQGYLVFCARHGDHVAVLAETAPAPERKAELLRIVDHCRRVPARPPRTFWEACQALWFCFMFLPDAPGRVDQYLAPYYEADLARGEIDPDRARELLACLWVKYFAYAGAQQGVSALHHLTLGGTKPDGSDACNPVTLLCLDVTEDLRLHRPQVGLRCSNVTPKDVLRRAVRVLRNRCGNPDFCNDEQIVPALMNAGVAEADARDFSLSGCHEVIVTGKAQMGSVEGFINLPKILRLTLGLEPKLGKGADLERIGSYDALWDALVDTMDRVAEDAHAVAWTRDQLEAERPGGILQVSLVVRDCIEKALGYTQGGARYNFCNWNIIGLANLADSLVALRTLVFEEQTMDLAAFAEMLSGDWRGAEPLRARIRGKLPRFGNDEDGADTAARRIIETFSALLRKHKPYRGGEYILGTTAGGENMHIEFGRVTGATPDGRAAGSPLADSMGASQGGDRLGVTALLNSVAKLPHVLLPTAATLNVKLDPKMLESDEEIDKIVALIQAHFRAGGQQFQFNLVNREMLIAAKRAPGQYKDLMVRVAGYSAPFTALWEDIQDEIIARTEHAV